MPTLGRLVAATAATALATSMAAALVAAPAAGAASSLVVWADPAHTAIVQSLLPNGYKGLPVTVVAKDPATVRAELVAATAATAPDVLWGDLAWTGDLSLAGAIVPVRLATKAAAQFRPNVLAGQVVAGDRYGLPVQVSNLALVTNADLVPRQPSTFDDLARTALDLKAKGKASVPLAVAQGPGATPWSTYPLFAGLGGYLFGPLDGGGLDARDIGLANAVLNRHAARIDSWNAAGLIDAGLSVKAAKRAFQRGKSAFWLAGPEDLQSLLALGFTYRITAVPPIIPGLATSPLLTVHGFMVTRWAAEHGLESAARALVGKFMAQPAPQQALAAGSGWYPANTAAAATVATGGGRVKAIGLAGLDGVPMPNLPQAAALWGPYAGAWAGATGGAGAIPAAAAFRAAEAAAYAAILGG